MITLKSDIADLILQNTFIKQTSGLNNTINTITSGYKVNHAKDNAAGYSIITDLSTRINSMLQIQSNTDDGISMLQTAQGGLEEILNLMERLRALTAQAANGTYDDKSRNSMQAEADAIIDEIARLRESGKYSGINLYYTPNNDSISDAADKPITSSISNIGAYAAGIDFAEYSVQSSISLLSETNILLSTVSETALEGAEAFAGNETRTITIDGVQYTVQNKLSTANDLSYSKDTSTGELTLIGSNFVIMGQNDISHNLIISGSYNNIYGGELNDVITQAGDFATNNYIYGGAGDDIFNIDKGFNAFIYGGDGNDTINTKITNTSAYGENGNDVFNIYARGYYYGGNGEDTFNVMSGVDNATVNGNAGTNAINDNGTNTTKINVPDANTFAESFNSGETKELTINGIQYTVKNKVTTQDFVYSIADNGQINFISNNFTIQGDINKIHNVYISGMNNTFYGSNLADTIVTTGSSTSIYALGGNDNITLNSFSFVYAGDGDDTITVKTNGCNNAVYGEAGNDTLIISGGGCSYFDLGEGDDNVVINGNNNNIAITGASGNNTITGTAYNSLFNGFTTSDDTSFLSIAGQASKEIEINGKKYTVQNNTSQAASIIYYYNPVDGKISFCGNKVTIIAQEDVSHDVILYGKHINFYGGNLDDTVINYAYGSHLYGQAGNDTLTNYAPDSLLSGEEGDDYLIANIGTNISGGDGNDTIDINFQLTSHNINGGSGNDIYNINKKCAIMDTDGDNIYNINTDGANISGSPGSDTFYLSGNNNTVLGAGGDDYFVIDGNNNNIDGGTGNNYYIDNGTGTLFSNVNKDPNAGGISFTYLGEVKTFTLNGKTYTVTNNLSGTNMLQYSLNPNTGVITLNGSDFEVNAEADEQAILNIRGDNNIINGSNLADTITIESGNGNTVNGLAGNDVLVMKSENNSLQGGSGNDKITLNASTGMVVNGGSGNDTITVNADNCTSIDTGSGNDNITLNGEGNSVELNDGNNTVKIISSNNTVNAGDGDNTITVSGSSNTITSLDGKNTIGIDGTDNNISVGDGNGQITVLGNGNTIVTAKGDNIVTIKGDSNSYSSQSGTQSITVTGTTNEITTANGDNSFTIKGDENNITAKDGVNEILINGNKNNYQGGDGADNITIKGNSNIAKGGGSNDTFLVSSGSNNVINGEDGSRNTMLNNGTNTLYSNVVDITPRPFEVKLKVDTGSGDDKFITTSISFNLFDFSVDYSTAESAAASLNDIDELINNIQEQLVNIGASINRLQYAAEAQTVKLNNMISTRSTLRDADIAEESSNYIKYQILQQASAALIASSRNIKAQNVLGLLNALK